MALPNRVLFGFPIYSDVGIYTPAIAGGSWNSALPLSNLQDRRLAQVARSTDTMLASTKFVVDLGVERLVRVIGLPKHSLSTLGKVKIKGSLVAGTTWVLQSGGFGANAVNAAIYANALFVAGGAAGTLRTAPDPTSTWTARTSNFGSDAIRGFCYAAALKLFVAVGDNAKLSTSPDGITWTARTSGFGADNIRAVAYGKGLFVAVGAAGKLFTSPDGTTWTSRTSQFGANQINGVAFSEALGLFVTVGAAGTLATSPDGITWTLRTSQFGANGINGVTWSGYLGLFVAVGAAGTLTTSPDGFNWTTRTSQFGSTAINGVAYGNGVFIAVGASGTLTTSADGTTWTARTSQFGSTAINCVTAGYGYDLIGGALAADPGVATSAATFYDSGFLDVWPAIYPAGSLPSDDPRLTTGKITLEDAQGYPIGFVHVPATAQTARWWQLEIDDQYHPLGYIDVARLAITGGWQPTINPAYGLKLGRETASSRQETDGGAAVYNEKTNRRAYTGAIQGLPEDEALVNAFEMQRALGITKQLLFAYDPNDTSHLHRRAFLGVLRQLDPMESAMVSRYGVPFAVVEEL